MDVEKIHPVLSRFANASIVGKGFTGFTIRTECGRNHRDSTCWWPASPLRAAGRVTKSPELSSPWLGNIAAGNPNKKLRRRKSILVGPAATTHRSNFSFKSQVQCDCAYVLGIRSHRYWRSTGYRRGNRNPSDDRFEFIHQEPTVRRNLDGFCHLPSGHFRDRGGCSICRLPARTPRRANRSNGRIPAGVTKLRLIEQRFCEIRSRKSFLGSWRYPQLLVIRKLDALAVAILLLFRQRGYVH